MDILIFSSNSSDMLSSDISVAINLILTTSKFSGVASNFLSPGLKTNHLGKGFPSASSAL